MEAISSYEHRPAYFRDVDRETWINGKWQQKHAVRRISDLQEIFPHLFHVNVKFAEAWNERGLRYALTPYMLSLMARDGLGSPDLADPLWRQFFPMFPELLATGGQPAPDEYTPDNENWEVAEEMISPIAHRKYDNRVIIYLTDTCFAYCLSCLRSLQSTAIEEKHGSLNANWQATLQAIRDRPEIEEVIFSGGDPLLLDNDSLGQLLHDVRDIPSVRAIRIHTRAWTHNPYRIDDGFCELLRTYQVTELGVHVVHPNELSVDFDACIERIRKSGARTLLLAQLPLLKGINDNADVLRQHFMKLYVAGVQPYYLIHCMPNVPAAASHRTSVRRGVELMNKLKRHISNPAMPEYIITHRTGKCTVPLEPDGTPEFHYTTNAAGWPIVRFKDWKGDWQEYLDGRG